MPCSRFAGTPHVCLFVFSSRPSPSRDDSAGRIEPGQNVRRELDQQRNGFVYAPNDICQEFWLLWPAVNEKAISDGTFLIFDVFPSIGNLFLALKDLLQVRITCTRSGVGMYWMTVGISVERLGKMFISGTNDNILHV